MWNDSVSQLATSHWNHMNTKGDQVAAKVMAQGKQLNLNTCDWHWHQLLALESYIIHFNVVTSTCCLYISSHTQHTVSHHQSHNKPHQVTSHTPHTIMSQVTCMPCIVTSLVTHRYHHMITMHASHIITSPVTHHAVTSPVTYRHHHITSHTPNITCHQSHTMHSHNTSHTTPHLATSQSH